MILGGWSRKSNETARKNARAAALAVSMRRIERAEVEQFLEELPRYDPAPPDRRPHHRRGGQGGQRA